MSTTVLHIGSFSKAPSDEDDQDLYIANERIEIGGATYEAHILPASGEAISAEMLELMNATIARLRRDFADIEQLLYQHYKACEEQALTDSVPPGLQLEALRQYIKQRSIIVGDPMDVEPCVEHRLYFDVEWDEEHGVYLELIDDCWEFSDVL